LERAGRHGVPTLTHGASANMLNLEMLARSRMAGLGTPMPMTSMPLAEGDEGTNQTIQQMRRLIDEGKKDPVVHETAAWILKQARVAAFDWMGELRAIYDWGRANVRYTRDVQGKETLHSAREIIRLGIGDCDDFTILYCALCGTIGMRCRIVTIASHPGDPTQFSHVYPEALVGKQWVTMDAARMDPAFGKGPRNYFRKRYWDASSDDYEDVAGLNGLGTMPEHRPPFGLGQQPGNLPVAYRPDVYPPFQQLRSVPTLGMGTYGPRALKGLGQTSTDWGATTAELIASSAQGAANIITAARQPVYPTYGVSPYAYPAAGTQAAVATTLQPSTLLLIGGVGVGLLALFMFSRRRV